MTAGLPGAANAGLPGVATGAARTGGVAETTVTVGRSFVVKKTVLDNGVRLLTENLPHAHSVTVGLWVQAGSRDENESNGGVSHFIEHMAFKGTAKRGPLDIAREIDRMGGMANAFTSKEHTCFHARTLPEHLPLLSDLLLDIFLNPAMDPQELERERQVILQEISSVEDAPDELAHVLFSQKYWGGHPLGEPILGSGESIGCMTQSTISEYMQRAYTAGGLVVSAVGKLEHGEILELMGEKLSELPTKPMHNGRKPPKPAPGLHLKRRELEQVHVVMGSKAPSAVAPDRYAAALLNLILGGSMSSRLFQEVREKRGLAYSVYSFLNSYCDAGLLGIYMGVPAERLAEALSVVRSELERLAVEPVSAEELDDAKTSLKGSILLTSENPETNMGRLARNEYNFGRSLSLDEVLDNLMSVSLDDIASIASQVADGANLGGLVLGPADEDCLVQGSLL